MATLDKRQALYAKYGGSLDSPSVQAPVSEPAPAPSPTDKRAALYAKYGGELPAIPAQQPFSDRLSSLSPTTPAPAASPVDAPTPVPVSGPSVGPLATTAPLSPFAGPGATAFTPGESAAASRYLGGITRPISSPTQQAADPTYQPAPQTPPSMQISPNAPFKIENATLRAPTTSEKVWNFLKSVPDKAIQTVLTGASGVDKALFVPQILTAMGILDHPSDWDRLVKETMPDISPTTRKVADVGGQIAGGLATIGGAGLTGGALAEGLATRVLPEAAQSTAIGQALIRGARGLGTGLALAGAKEGANALAGESKPGSVGRVGREAVFFGLLDAVMPGVGGAVGSAVRKTLPAAARDTVLGSALASGLGGSVAGGSVSAIVNTLFKPESDDDRSTLERVLTDAAQIGLFGAFQGATGARPGQSEAGAFQPPEGGIKGQVVGGRIFRGIPEGELQAATEAKGDLSQLGYSEWKPNSGVWQMRDASGNLTREIHEDVIVSGRQVPKVVADRVSRTRERKYDWEDATDPANPPAEPAVNPPAVVPEADSAVPPVGPVAAKAPSVAPTPAPAKPAADAYLRAAGGIPELAYSMANNDAAKLAEEEGPNSARVEALLSVATELKKRVEGRKISPPTTPPTYRDATVENATAEAKRQEQYQLAREGQSDEKARRAAQVNTAEVENAGNESGGYALADVPVDWFSVELNHIDQVRQNRLQEIGGSKDPVFVTSDPVKTKDGRLVLSLMNGNNRVVYARNNGAATVKAFVPSKTWDAILKAYFPDSNPVTIDRAQLLRDANPGMDERAILDMVKTTVGLSADEFTAFAQRAGKPEATAPSHATAKEPHQMTREEFQRGKLRYLGPDSVADGGRKAGMAWTQTQQAELDFAKRLGLNLYPTTHDGLMVYAKTDKDASALVNGLNTGMQDPALSGLLGYTDEDRKAMAKYGWQAHHDAVAKALSEGKPVPPEVLAEYPDLASAKTNPPTEDGGTGQPAPLTPAPAGPQTGAKVSLNAEKGYVEITFPKKPDASAVNKLTKAGFRWGRLGLMYAEDTPANRALAEKIIGGSIDVQTPTAPSELETKARAAFQTDDGFRRFLADPNGWRILLTKPDSAQGRFWVTKRAEEAGNTAFPQKVADLLEEQKALLAQSMTKQTRDNLARVKQDLEKAIQLATKPAEKTAMERVLNGEEATSLTGKSLPPGAIEGKTAQPTPDSGKKPATTQQTDLFSEESEDQLASYHAELEQIRREQGEAKRKRDDAIDAEAKSLAKDATARNNKERKEFWRLITEVHGFIRPYAAGYLKEDLTNRIPAHLKRKKGSLTLDQMASSMGKESEEALVREIEGYAKVGAVDPSYYTQLAEEAYDYSQEGQNAKILLDYYHQAVKDLEAAIAELEGSANGGQAQERNQGAEARAEAGSEPGGVSGEASGNRGGNRQEGQGRGGEEGGRVSDNESDKAVDEVQAMAAPGQILGSTPPTASKGKVRRIEIVRHFAKGLGIPIRTGRFMQKALGIFKVRSEAIRTKLAEDLRTITHEVGHFLDKRLSLADPQFDAELLPLGRPTSGPRYTRAQIRAEGVAEFTNLYLTDKAQAQAQAPGFFAHFEQAVKGHKRISRVIADGQDMLHIYVSQNATDMVKSGISYTPPKKGWTWERLRKIGLNLYEAWTDKHDPLQVAEKAMNKGQRLPNRLSPFAQASLARGWEGLAKAFLEKGAQRWDPTTQSYKTVGPSLDAILKPIGDRLDDFAAYAAAMRALYLHKSRGWDDTKLPFPLWAARDTVRQYSSPEFAKALKELQKFQDAVLDHYAEAGFLTKAQLAKIRAANKVYVPYLREQVEEGPGMRQILGPKYANVSNAVIKMHGGTGTVINPLHSIVHNTFKLINLAERNKVGVLLANQADQADGGASVIEDVTKSFRPATFSLEQIKDVLNDELAHTGLDVDDLGIDMSAMATVFSPNTMPSGGDAQKGIFAVYRNGKTKFYQGEPELYRALTAMDKPALNAFFKALSYHTHLKRTFAVVTPEFIMRNFGRDAQTSGVYGRGLPLEAHMRGFIAQIFNKEAVTRWEAGGGFASSMVSADRDYQAETIKGLVAKNKMLKENLMPPWRALQNLSEFIERAPKVGEMLMAEEGSALEHKLLGLGKGKVDTSSAILESKDLNLDFGRSGNLGQQYNSITAFFNAWQQDIDKFVRMHTNRKTAFRTITRGIMFITMPTFLLWMRNKDDEEYKEFPQWRKDLFWNFKIGDRWYWWPAPHMLALAYKSIPERIFNAIYQSDSKAFTKDFGETAQTLAGPNTIPDTLALLAELKFNWDLFGDRPIVPKGEERKEPAQQAGPYTSETEKRVGGALNVSPRKVEQAVRGTLAGGGQYGLAATDKLLEGYDRLSGRPLPPARSEREPSIVRAFSSANPLSSGAQSIDDFYELKEKHDTLWASLPGRAGIDKPLGDYATWKSEEKTAFKRVIDSLSKDERELIGPDFNKWRLVGKPGLNKTEQTMSAFSKAKVAVEKSGLSPEAKARELDRINRLRLDTARKALGKPPMP